MRSREHCCSHAGVPHRSDQHVLKLREIEAGSRHRCGSSASRWRGRACRPGGGFRWRKTTCTVTNKRWRSWSGAVHSYLLGCVAFLHGLSILLHTLRFIVDRWLRPSRVCTLAASPQTTTSCTTARSPVALTSFKGVL